MTTTGESTEETQRFFINEFAIDSSIKLACDAALRPTSGANTRHSIRVRRGNLSDIPCLLRKIRPQICYDVGTGFLIEPHHPIALFIDRRNDEVIIDSPDPWLPVATTWFYNSVLGAITLLKGGLPLHAAGLEVEGRRIGLIANSGTGKSTLTHYLLQQGGVCFANDDLIPVYAEEELFYAYPSISLYPKIHQDTALQSGIDLATLIPVRDVPVLPEYYVPIEPRSRAVAPAPLSALFLLTPEDKPSGAIAVDRLTDEEGSGLLRKQIHADWVVNKHLGGRRIDRACEAVAARIPLLTLRYHRDFSVLPRLADIIATTVRSLPLP